MKGERTLTAGPLVPRAPLSPLSPVCPISPDEPISPKWPGGPFSPYQRVRWKYQWAGLVWVVYKWEWQELFFFTVLWKYRAECVPNKPKWKRVPQGSILGPFYFWHNNADCKDFYFHLCAIKMKWSHVFFECYLIQIRCHNFFWSTSFGYLLSWTSTVTRQTLFALRSLMKKHLL